jgi:hypothetical protein
MLIKIFLNPGKEYLGKGEIDPNAKIGKIKEDIVTEFNLGDPDDFIFITESHEDRKPNDDMIQDGDSIYLTRAEKPPSFKRVPD